MSDFRLVCPGSRSFLRIPEQFYFQKNPRSKIYYAKWTLQIELVNGKKFICNCIFEVYLVTGTKNPDISQEGTFRISKYIFYITTKGGFWNSFSYKIVLKTRKIPWGNCLTEFYESFINLLDEKVFQKPQIFRKTLRLFPEQSTLGNP
jgi:hypothetical protein